MPRKPRIRPAMRLPVIGPPSNMNRSVPTIQNGMAATRTAVSPLGTVCSAQTTPPLPTPFIRTPTSAYEGHEAREGSFTPRAIRPPVSKLPAMSQRNDAIRNGGTVSSAMRIPRYVVPQTMHTTTQAVEADVLDATIEGSSGLVRRGDETFSCDRRFDTQTHAVSTLLLGMIQGRVGARDDGLRVDLGGQGSGHTETCGHVENPILPGNLHLGELAPDGIGHAF